MKTLFTAFVLILGVLCASTAVNAAGCKDQNDQVFVLNSDHCALITASSVDTTVSQSTPDSHSNDDTVVISLPDDRIHIPVLDVQLRLHAIGDSFVHHLKFEFSHAIRPPERQYSLLRILFRSIIASNAP